MDKILNCKNELRRLIKKSAFAKGKGIRYNLMIATYGKLAEFERLLTQNPDIEKLNKMLENTS